MAKLTRTITTMTDDLIGDASLKVLGRRSRSP